MIQDDDPSAPAAPPPAIDVDRICAEIRDRARYLAERARSLSMPDTPIARHARARLLETDAETIADLAEELLRAAAGLAASAHQPARRPGPEGEPEGRPRILLAGDDPAGRDALAAALQEAYDLSVATDGHQALAAARLGTPDLVLLDLQRSGLDGMAVLDALRGEAQTAELPVVVLSGRADDEARVRALDLGAADVLESTVSPQELRARIDRTLRLTRRQVQLRQLAGTDALTGLANVRAFRVRLDDEIRRARRYGTALTCIMIDLDHLKPVNDAFGHAAGDRAIASVAEVIRAQLRATDLAARYGGDEFVLLLPHTPAADGRILADRLCARLAGTELALGGRKVALRASFGVAELEPAAGPAPAGDEGADLVRRADEALYAAKRSGRGRVEIFGLPAAP